MNFDFVRKGEKKSISIYMDKITGCVLYMVMIESLDVTSLFWFRKLHGIFSWRCAIARVEWVC